MSERTETWKVDLAVSAALAFVGLVMLRLTYPGDSIPGRYVSTVIFGAMIMGGWFTPLVRRSLDADIDDATASDLESRLAKLKDDTNRTQSTEGDGS